MLKQWFGPDKTLTKRELGALMIAAGIALAGGMLLVELAGGKQGVGMIQWLGVAGGAASVVLGLTLLPLGDQAA